ncbi:hypothetical protein ACH470_07130 [Streptomyces bottropensis]|jgi:hypothetical protein|uniref:hypothetical protein n=1 Tax=Streptomyces bottropensis TaxID=42235 RepID=UPI00378B6AB3
MKNCEPGGLARQGARTLAARFRLSVDPTEKTELGSEPADCLNQVFTVELAR